MVNFISPQSGSKK